MLQIKSLLNLPEHRYPIVGLDEKAKVLGKIVTNGFTVLLGEAGCGKTTLVQKMQQMYPSYCVLRFAHIDERLSFNADLWSCLMQLVENKDSNQYVVFIDEFQRVLLDNEFPDFMSLFLDSIDKFKQHQVYFIGEITSSEYQMWLKSFKKENNNIQIMTITEPDIEMRYKILKSRLPQALQNKKAAAMVLTKLASSQYGLRDALLILDIMTGYNKAKHEAFDQNLLDKIAKIFSRTK